MWQKLADIKTRNESFFSSPQLAKIGELTIPWILFLAMLVWAWRVRDLFHEIPFYGDVFEVLWGITWYGDHLLDGQFIFYPLVFHPEGWYVATFAYGPALFIPMLPLYAFGGAAFAYNATSLVSAFLVFAGMYLLTRRMTQSSFVATLAALLFTFWGFRWLRIAGH